MLKLLLSAEWLIDIGIIFGIIFFVFLTLRIRYISHVLGITFAILMIVGYAFRDELFPVIFGNFEDDSMLQKFLRLGVYIAVFTFLWFVYVNSASWLKDDEDGWVIWRFTDSGISKWSIFGWMSLTGVIAAAIVGFGVAWLNCYVWGGFIYILLAIQIIVGIVLMIFG